MLYFPQTSIEISRERPVALGRQITAEGAALVADLTGGQFGVRLSSGGAGEKFAGISLNHVTSLLTVPRIETLTVGAAAAFLLAAEAVPGSLRVVRQADGQVYAEAGTPGATAYDIDNANARKINFVAGDVAKTFLVSYRYSPTLVQAMALQGNTLPGGPAGQYLGQIGVITRGDVYTDQWDTTADWSTAVGVKLAANGLFTPTAVAADVLPGTQIIELPSVGRAYLGLNINAVS